MNSVYHKTAAARGVVPDKSKVLVSASVISHIINFHLPHLERFACNGFEIHVAAGGETVRIPFANRIILLPFRKSMWAGDNFRAALMLRRLIRSENYSLICTHTALAAFFTRIALLGMRHRPMVINTVHGYLFDENSSFVKRYLLLLAEQITAPVTDLLIVMNRCDFEIAHKYRLCRNIRSISGIGVDFSRLDGSPEISRVKLRERLGIPQDAFVFIYPAEFSRRKNQIMVIRALKQLPENAFLVLPGDGVLREKCIHEVKASGLSNRIVFPGYISDMQSYYAMADAAVTTSRSEGIPFNVLEAMYMGLPVAATEVKGHIDLIRDGENGFLFAFGNVSECAEKMRALMESKLFLPDNKEILKKYGKEVVVKQYEELWMSLLKGEVCC